MYVYIRYGKKGGIGIIALDQSTKCTGWSYWEDGVLLDYGMIDLHNIKDVDNRLVTMFKEITDIISTYPVDRLVIEDTQYQHNQASYKCLAQLQGMILGYCVEKGLHLDVIAATAWRKRLGFKQGQTKRRELKEQALNYVNSTMQKKLGEDEIDTAEAICIGCAMVR